MTQSAYTLKLGSTEYPVSPVKGSYTGYHYQQELAVQPLLGKDPVRASKNEVIQSTGLGSKDADLDVYATETEKEALLGILWAKVTHNDGITAGTRNVVVMKVTTQVYRKTKSLSALFKVHVTLREY